MPTVAIIGASPKSDRYSHQAVLKFRERGYTVYPVNPAGQEVDGLKAFRTLAEVPGNPDIVCMYVNPTTGVEMLDQIVAKRPRVLWLNPGADGEPLASAARAKGINVVEACSLVALSYGDPLEKF
ncbi:MAG: CoA-binding protein [Planctomycetes bacterium]|nr:CoA-binding protein [Planctomycetota bacterium]